MYDIIPDIHGQFDKLRFALKRLGYAPRGGAWRHADPARTCIFLGDFIDRGPENGAVIALVRAMLDAGTACAVMGNHELNAIHFHTLHPDTGAPLRPRSEKNTRQHRAFLDEFAPGDTRTAEVIGWMQTLPLYLECEHFRAVHACWDVGGVARIGAVSRGGVLDEAQLIGAADSADALYEPVETLTKGPEADLPPGYAITDKDGTIRREVRVKWWKSDGRRWADIAISVPDPAQLPPENLPDALAASTYPADAKPVFFGHYWLVGTPVLQAQNALCLDYSAGRDGPLVTCVVDGAPVLSLDDVIVHDARA